MDLVRSLQSGRKKQPKLERKKAKKNFNYEVAGLRSHSMEISPSSSSVSPPSSIHLASQKSFRIDGEVDKDFSNLFKTLGFDPEDFAITSEELEAAGMVSSPATSSDAVDKETSEISLPGVANPDARDTLPGAANSKARATLPDVANSNPRVNNDVNGRISSPGGWKSNEEQLGGIKGPRPPKLVPPPVMSVPSHDHKSTWDIFHGLAPVANERRRDSSDSEKEPDEDEDEDDTQENGLRQHASASCSPSSSSTSDSPTAIVEGAFYISANANLKRNMVYWVKGKRLGSGSFGTVFEGISNNGFFFAIKEVSLLDGGPNAKQCISQLEQEIDLLRQFEHENIVEYYGTDKADSYLYIFLELVTQGSLANLYQSYKLGDSQVSVYTRQILNGLKYLHERGVVHRDIKCANLLVDARGSVKLADFGLAKQISQLNEMKSSKGSAFWMAPEVINPKGSYGPPADIWSLGCTVLEMLTGQLPYPNQEWIQVLMKVGKGGQPEIPTSLSRDARDFIQQCVQRNPKDRPTAAELLEHPFAMRPLQNSSSSGSSHGRSHRSRTPSTAQS